MIQVYQGDRGVWKCSDEALKDVLVGVCSGEYQAKKHGEAILKALKQPCPDFAVLPYPYHLIGFTVTPSLAARLLQRNKSNRPFKKLSIERYCSAMRRPNGWDVNGETLKFSQSGLLLDGQNRLMSCVLTNTMFTTDIRFGLLDEDIRNIDQGLKRTKGENYNLLHGGVDAHGREREAISNAAFAAVFGNIYKNDCGSMQAFSERYEASITWAVRNMPSKSPFGQLRKAEIMLAFVLIHAAKPYLAEQVLSQIQNMSGGPTLAKIGTLINEKWHKRGALLRAVLRGVQALERGEILKFYRDSDAGLNHFAPDFAVFVASLSKGSGLAPVVPMRVVEAAE